MRCPCSLVVLGQCATSTRLLAIQPLSSLQPASVCRLADDPESSNPLQVGRRRATPTPGLRSMAAKAELAGAVRRAPSHLNQVLQEQSHRRGSGMDAGAWQSGMQRQPSTRAISLMSARWSHGPNHTLASFLAGQMDQAPCAETGKNVETVPSGHLRFLLCLPSQTPADSSQATSPELLRSTVGHPATSHILVSSKSQAGGSYVPGPGPRGFVRFEQLGRRRFCSSREVLFWLCLLLAASSCSDAGCTAQNS